MDRLNIVDNRTPETLVRDGDDRWPSTGEDYIPPQFSGDDAEKFRSQLQAARMRPYSRCCICERVIAKSDGFSSSVGGRVHITCENGAINFAHELAQLNQGTLPDWFCGPGMVNHFRENREAMSRERERKGASINA